VDILEFLTTGQPADAGCLLDAVRHHAAGRPIRWPLAANDPMTAVVRAAGFEKRWGFELLIRPLDPALALRSDMTRFWVYAGVDYI
jgi:hypothetical protein